MAEVKTMTAPDLVVEILSPRTAKHDRGIKYDVYERAGVRVGVYDEAFESPLLGQLGKVFEQVW